MTSVLPFVPMPALVEREREWAPRARLGAGS